MSESYILETCVHTSKRCTRICVLMYAIRHVSIVWLLVVISIWRAVLILGLCCPCVFLVLTRPCVVRVCFSIDPPLCGGWYCLYSCATDGKDCVNTVYICIGDFPVHSFQFWKYSFSRHVLVWCPPGMDDLIWSCIDASWNILVQCENMYSVSAWVVLLKTPQTNATESRGIVGKP